MGKGGRWFLGVHLKIFELKGGPYKKMMEEGGSCRYMYWFEGGTQGKIGGIMQNFSEIIKNHRPYP